MTQTPVKFEDGTTLKERIADWTNTYADTLTANYKPVSYTHLTLPTKA